MTEKHKLLLLKDLSARLPYDTIVKFNNGKYFEDIKLKNCNITDVEDGYEPKPYLRPLASMTADERKELATLCDMHMYCRDIGYDGINIMTNLYDKQIYYTNLVNMEAIDWLNAHHFDYRGMIEMGLAIKVTEENNPYKNV